MLYAVGYKRTANKRTSLRGAGACPLRCVGCGVPCAFCAPSLPAPAFKPFGLFMAVSHN
ncbi:MAG: hypothetical protein ACK5IQ_04565 [Bacteroidales bacterium]